MKRIILFLLVLGSLAASAPPKASCNKAVQGSSFCAEHQRPAESRKGKGVDASFAMCVVVQNTVPCNRQAIPGKTICSYHEALLPPPPGQLFCGYPISCHSGELSCPCLAKPINASGRCASHYAPQLQ